MSAKNPIAMLMKLQQQMTTIQKAAEEAQFEGVAQNGLVTVAMRGTGELEKLNIDPSVLEEDAETVAALVLVAAGDAYKKKEAFAKQQLSKVAGSMNPLGVKLPGIG